MHTQSLIVIWRAAGNLPGIPQIVIAIHVCVVYMWTQQAKSSGEMLTRWELIAVDPLIADGRGSWGSFGNFGSHAKEV